MSSMTVAAWGLTINVSTPSPRAADNVNRRSQVLRSPRVALSYPLRPHISHHILRRGCIPPPPPPRKGGGWRQGLIVVGW